MTRFYYMYIEGGEETLDIYNIHGVNPSQALAAWLKGFHTGERNAITAAEIEKQLGVKTRRVRAMIQSMREDGAAIVSCNDGYYYAETTQDFNKCLEWLEYRIINLKHSIGLLEEEEKDARRRNQQA